MTDELEGRLAALDKARLLDLLLRRAGRDDEFRLWLGAELAVRKARETRAPLDPEAFRQRAEAIFSADPSRRRRGEWESGVDEAALEDLIEQAEPLLAAGDGANALAILTPVAGTLAAYWPECAPWDETLHEFFPMLDRMIAQAVLMEGVSRELREDLADDLSGWQNDVALQGADDAFAVSLAACTQGWDEPGLEDVMAGQGRAWPLAGKGGWVEERLTAARLVALEAMGRTDAFLNLSWAAGLHCDHAMMLVRLGRIDEAQDLARSRLKDPQDILRLVRLIEEAGLADMAFDLAWHGLSLPKDGATAHRPDRLPLAHWLRETARTHGRRDLALRAARAAFEEHFARDDFRAAESIAGPAEWPDMRNALLQRLMDASYPRDRLEILLEEGLIDDALSVVDRGREVFQSPHNPVLMRLAEAALARHPDWTIRFALRMANPIMEEGRSGHYDLAVRWLKLAAGAHAAAGRQDEWRASLDALIATHRRKRKLRALLDSLRKVAR